MELREAVISVLQEKGYHPITQGSYIQTIGPRFETRAEIRLYKDYFDVVGMTGAAEATLAQELGLGLCMVGIVDNMGHGLGDPLSVEVLCVVSVTSSPSRPSRRRITRCSSRSFTPLWQELAVSSSMFVQTITTFQRETTKCVASSVHVASPRLDTVAWLLRPSRIHWGLPVLRVLVLQNDLLCVVAQVQDEGGVPVYTRTSLLANQRVRHATCGHAGLESPPHILGATSRPVLRVRLLRLAVVPAVLVGHDHTCSLTIHYGLSVGTLPGLSLPYLGRRRCLGHLICRISSLFLRLSHWLGCLLCSRCSSSVTLVPSLSTPVSASGFWRLCCLLVLPVIDDPNRFIQEGSPQAAAAAVLLAAVQLSYLEHMTPCDDSYRVVCQDSSRLP